MAWLEQAAQLTIVLTFLGGLFAYVVLRPLNETLRELKDAINKLSGIQSTQNERLNRLEGAVERIEKAVITAHSRIDKYLQKEGGNPNEKLERG